MNVVRHSAPAAAVAVILVLGLPSLVVPQAVAASAPVEVYGSVEGWVLSDLGGPLGGALLEATGGGAAQTVYTDPDGHYGLKLPAGSWQFNVTARAYGAAKDSAVVLGGVPTAKNFTLVHSGPAITGRVLDAATGQGLGGARVEAYGASPYECRADQPCPMMAQPGGGAMPVYQRMPYATTSATDGRYALAIDPADKGTLSLHSWRDGYREGYQSAEVQGDTRLDLRLEPIPPKDATLEGRVVDASTGQPIAGAWVNAWPSYDPATGGAVPPTGAGSAGGSAGGNETATMPAPSPVPPCDDTGAADCRGPVYQEGNSTQTDQDGRFRLGLYAGRYQFSVGANEHGQHSEVVTLAQGERKNLDVRLEPIPGDTVTVRGTVVDRATGKPVAGAWVSVQNEAWGAYAGAQSDAAGRFELRTKPGWTQVWVRSDGGGYAQTGQAEPGQTEPAPPPSSPPASGSDAAIRAPDSRPYVQPSGSYYPWVRGQSFDEAQTVDWRVELVPKPAADVRIQGYVLDAATQQPLAQAYVNVHNEDTGDWGWAQTDAYGSFVLLGRPGWHTINANADGHFGNAVVVAVQGPATRVDLSLQPGQPQGYCCIMYASDGVAAEGGKGMAPAAAPPATPQAQQGSADAAGRNAQLAGSGAATYGASGESLGPYDPGQAPGTAGSGGANATPGFAPLAGLAALGAAAALLARRRR